MANKEEVKTTEAKAEEVKNTEVKPAAAKQEEKKAEEKKPVEKKAEEVKEAAKAVTKAATAKAKAAAKKTVAKAAAKAVELKPQIIVQYQNNEVEIAKVEERVKAQYVSEGHRAGSIKKMNIYIKPEEYSAYYVINEKFSGRVGLF